MQYEYTSGLSPKRQTDDWNDITAQQDANTELLLAQLGLQGPRKPPTATALQCLRSVRGCRRLDKVRRADAGRNETIAEWTDEGAL
jgi:hypothetical protein